MRQYLPCVPSPASPACPSPAGCPLLCVLEPDHQTYVGYIQAYSLIYNLLAAI